ncbi:MAG: hypothetical protein AAFS11_10485, partial [Planctomycetota bacterium]
MLASDRDGSCGELTSRSSAVEKRLGVPDRLGYTIRVTSCFRKHGSNRFDKHSLEAFVTHSADDLLQRSSIADAGFSHNSGLPAQSRLLRNEACL